MLNSDVAFGTQPNQGMTEESAASLFEASLSAEEDQGQPEEPQPQAQSPEAESAPQASTEQPETADESDTDEETAEQPEEPKTFRTKINGEEVEVTLDELLRGYSRTKDYTQKTQEVAERRRELEQQLPAVRAERQKIAQYLTELEGALQAVTPEEPDWNRVQAESPDEFPGLFAQWQAHEKRMHTIRQNKEAALEAVRRDNEQVRQERIRTERDKLLTAIPEWKDEAKAKAEKTKLVSFAVNDLGYTTQDLENIEDHRIFLVLRDAMRFRELNKAKPAIQQKIQAVKSATPGPTSSGGKVTQTKIERAKARLAKTGRQEDAAALFENYLDD